MEDSSNKEKQAPRQAPKRPAKPAKRGRIIPMHYKTPKVDFPISDVEPFLATQAQVERKTTSTIEITQATLPAERVIYVLPSER